MGSAALRGGVVLKGLLGVSRVPQHRRFGTVSSFAFFYDTGPRDGSLVLMVGGHYLAESLDSAYYRGPATATRGSALAPQRNREVDGARWNLVVSVLSPGIHFTFFTSSHLKLLPLEPKNQAELHRER